MESGGGTARGSKGAAMVELALVLLPLVAIWAALADLALQSF